MHSSVTFLFVLSLLVAALAGEKSKGRNRHGPDHRGPRKHPANIMFPACETFVDAMDNSAHSLMKANQIGPDACPDENLEDCMQTDAMKVRCSVEKAPSEECMAQMTAFLQGNTCNE
ncbi:hypothetical protein AVEN_118654-1 [Araneus ventricosus]|uniref:Uncharacterized protein n=1 Tax=Araneus ventricosus TaxID=182803 RepID=A0A4Y2AYK1_ARAVE|nr:hypothetical protein AVEN_118654-1 [Araneus ventricosus]